MKLKSGDRLVFVKNLRTPAAKYKKGDVLELIEPTGQAPWGLFTPPHNWMVKCKYFSPPQPESIWSILEYLIGVGILRSIK